MEGTYVAHARCINIIKFDHRSMPGIWPLDPRIFESSRINLTVSGIELCGSFLSSFFFSFFSHSITARTRAANKLHCREKISGREVEQFDSMTFFFLFVYISNISTLINIIFLCHVFIYYYII